jgi:hypothetical protein
MSKGKHVSLVRQPCGQLIVGMPYMVSWELAQKMMKCRAEGEDGKDCLDCPLRNEHDKTWQRCKAELQAQGKWPGTRGTDETSAAPGPRKSVEPMGGPPRDRRYQAGEKVMDEQGRRYEIGDNGNWRQLPDVTVRELLGVIREMDDMVKGVHRMMDVYRRYRATDGGGGYLGVRQRVFDQQAHIAADIELEKYEAILDRADGDEEKKILTTERTEAPAAGRGTETGGEAYTPPGR